LISASGSQEKQETVALKKGTEIKCAPIPLRLGSVDKSSFGGKKTYTRTFGLPKKLASVIVKIISYEKTETIEVPVKLSMGLGLR
jgi:hypothetical protein